MRKHVWIISIAWSLCLVSCSTIKVNVDFDDQFDFGAFRNFYFVAKGKVTRGSPGRPMLIKDPLFLKKAEREIEAVLSEKGYQVVGSPDEADFLVAFYATARDRATITPPEYRIGRWGRRWVAPGRVYHYKQGTLVIDIVDRTRRELVWRGVGSGVLDRYDPRKNLLHAVEKVLGDFPPL